MQIVKENSSLPLPRIIDLGLQPYSAVWELQKQYQQALIDGGGSEVLILCEHYPVITLGKSSDRSNLLLTPEAYQQAGIEVYDVERGGDVTFHGVGQLVAYPILNLNNYKKDVGWYMRNLEEVIIRTLARYSILGMRIKGKTGVWIADDTAQVDKKIASIGVRISRWCTLHGLSVNIGGSLQGFDYINPCGFQNIIMTSMQKESSKAVLNYTEIAKVLVEEFGSVFGQ